MPIYSNEELLEQLRAIGWEDIDIAREYPDLLPEYGRPPATTLYERLLSIGWTDEQIRAEYPEILPESEGGILEVPGEEAPEGYIIGGVIGDPGGQGTQYDPIYDPYAGVSVPDGGPYTEQPYIPSVGGDQTTDLLSLALIFL